VIMTKGTELTPKLSIDMVSSPWKLFFEALSHGFPTQNTKEEFWHPRGIPGEGRRREKREEGQAIYRESSPPIL
jgi:hypothetical protein